MTPFRKRRRGGFVAEFDANEAELLTNLVGQVLALLQDRNGDAESAADPLARMVGMDGPMHAPDDPVLARLLPDAYRDSPEDATEFRRFTERSLSDAKVDHGNTVLTSLLDAGFEPGGDRAVEIELDMDGAWSWLKSLTDVRLAMAARIGIDDESDLALLHEATEESLRAMADIYEWLGYVQESLVHAMSQ